MGFSHGLRVFESESEHLMPLVKQATGRVRWRHDRRQISGHDIRIIYDPALAQVGEPHEIWGSPATLL